MGLTAIFDIGKSGILSYQKALEVVSHNIANAATEGYTRQDVVFQNMPSGVTGARGVSGRGVNLADIRRMYDAFLELQLKTESSRLSYWNIYQKGLIRIENIFNDASDIALSNVINDFFNAWQELSQNPQGTAERSLLLDKAGYLANRISISYKSLIDERQEIYVESQNLVNQINQYLDQINELNEKIASSPGALDAKDQRDNFVKKLNDIVKINYFEDISGRYTILLGGMPLVDGGRVYHLSVGLDSNQNMQFNLEAISTTIDVTSLIQDGKLKADIDLRDNLIPEYMNKLNMFVFDMTEAVNARHRLGYGLDRSTDNNFFSPLYEMDISKGDIEDIVYKIMDTYTGTYHEYQIQYKYDGTKWIWTVTDNTTGKLVTDVNVVGPWTEDSDEYYKLSFNNLEITLKNITLDPADGLDFTFQIKSNTAIYFGVALTDPQRIAAAGADPTGSSGKMDNENAKAIYDLFDDEIIGNSKPIDYYRTIVSEIGVYSSSTQTQRSFQEALVEEIKKLRQDASGVSLDEEAVNLIKFQKMYEASARVIRIADEILSTLFDLVR